MTMDNDQRDDDALDALFAAGKAARPQPDADFMARLQADVERALPKPDRPVLSQPPRANWWAGLFTASGLSGAALAGVWIGFAMPETLDGFSVESETTIALSSFLPGADLGSVFDE